MVQFIDERKDIPEEISYLELEFVIIFLIQTLFYLRNLIFSSLDIILCRRLSKPTIIFTITLLEPEKSGESLHKTIVEVSPLLQAVQRA